MDSLLVTTLKNVILCTENTLELTRRDIRPQDGFTLNREILLRTIHTGLGPYYGLTWDREQMYVASQKRGCILVFDKDLNVTGRLKAEKLKGLHQIGYFNGKLYICESRRNRLRIWDGERLETWNYTGTTEDRDHINSVWSDGEKLYVGEHRKRKGARVQVFDFNLNLLETINGLGHELHNVYVEKGKLHICWSKRGCLLVRNLENQDERHIDLRKHFEEGYPRGLARTRNRWYVGMSRLAVRSERHLGRAAILVLDDDFNHLKTIPLEQQGQIYEVRATTGVDRAHNRLPFPA